MSTSLFVDDLAAELAGSGRWIRRHLGGFLLMVCRDITKAGMEESAKKSVCLASTEELGRQLQNDLQEFGISYVQKAKALGSGLAAGVRSLGLGISESGSRDSSFLGKRVSIPPGS